MMVNDLMDNLESLDELQTCRGTICIDYYMLKRATAKFRDALLSSDDRYQRENEEKLREMLGKAAARDCWVVIWNRSEIINLKDEVAGSKRSSRHCQHGIGFYR